MLGSFLETGKWFKNTWTEILHKKKKIKYTLVGKKKKRPFLPPFFHITSKRTVNSLCKYIDIKNVYSWTETQFLKMSNISVIVIDVRHETIRSSCIQSAACKGETWSPIILINSSFKCI